MWERFAVDTRGGIAIIFALLLIPVMGLVGAAVDYSRAAHAHTDLQAAVDAAALAAGKIALEQNRREVRREAREVFDAIFQRNDRVRVTDFSVTREDDILTVEARARVPMMFADALDKKRMHIAATASVPTTQMGLELVLVLDNTGSMAVLGKMHALKQAAKDLIDTIQKASTSAHASIAIVAFNSQVAVGATHRDASWLRFTPGGPEPVLKVDKAAWTGCISDRDKPHDVRDTLPTGGQPDILYPAALCQYPDPPLLPIKPLSRDFAGLKLAIDAMNPAGNTNTQIGLAWGLAMLTPGAPLSTAQPPKKHLQKTIVFLTDGLNTQNRWTTDPVQIDGRTSRVCEEIKAAKINLYTVRVIEGNETLLRNCASDPTMYYPVRHASELSEVFKKIAGEITTPRLSH
jgi:Flp pilus assembly protein TadG